MTIATINLSAMTYPKVLGRGTVYETARATSFDVETYLDCGQLFSNPYYYCMRPAIKFNTNIGSEYTINQVNLKMAMTYDYSDTDFDVVIVKYNWSASDPLSSINKETVYDGVLAATADDNVWGNSSGKSLNTYYTSGNLNTAWINKNGDTYYGLISSRDISSSTPSGEEYVIFDTADKVPQLIVNYSGGSQSVWFMMKRTKELWDKIGGIYQPHDLGVTTI